MSVEWTAEARAPIIPWRGGPVTPRAFDVADARQAVVAELVKNRAAYALGATLSEPRCAAHTRAALAFIDGQDLPDAEAAGAMYTLLAHGSLAARVDLVRVWLGTRGCAFAVGALVASFRFAVGGGARHLIEASDVATPAGAGKRRVWGPGLSTLKAASAAHLSWLEIRGALAACSDEEHAKALEVARAAYAEAPFPIRCGLSFLFPGEEEWCVELVPDERLANEHHGAWCMAVLLATTSDPDRAAALAALGRGRSKTAEAITTLLARLGERAVPALRLLAEKREPVAIDLLMRVHTVEALRALLPVMAQKKRQKALAAHFRAHRELAIAAFSPFADDASSKYAPQAKLVLAGLFEPPPPAESAPLEALPPVLVDPPWERKREEKTPKLDLAAISVPTALVWELGEREEWAARGGDPNAKCTWQECSAKGKSYAEHSERQWAEKIPKYIAFAGFIYPHYLAHGSRDAVLDGWSSLSDEQLTRCPAWCANGAAAAVAKYGADMAPTLFRWIALHPSEQRVTDLLLPFDGTAAAELALGMYLRGKRGRAFAEAWMRRHPRAAARIAIPRALRADKASASFIDVLRWMAAIGHAEVVDTVADEYGAKAALQAVVGKDPLSRHPQRMPKLPDFFRPHALAPIVHRATSKPLPSVAVQRVATMLAFSPLDPPYAGIREVKDACTPESLREHAWGLFQAWLAVGAPMKEVWAMRALGHFGDDEIARRLTPLLSAWPGESVAQRAVEALAVLGAIGTDVALFMLSGIADRVRFGSIRDAANDLMDGIAASKGLSREDLADRLVPDLGLDARGEASLDYGARQFKIQLDERLAPRIVDSAGRRLAALPKPSAKDTPVLARRAQERLKVLKKDLAAVAESRVARLEAAMIARQRWREAEFRALFLEKPVTLQLARRLIWGAYDARGAALLTFRADEGGALADVSDVHWDLPAGARIGLPHPLDLDERTRGAWARLLAEYGLAQPFPQLGRECYRPTEQDLASAELVSLHGIALPAPKLVYGLEELRWVRGEAEEGGWFHSHRKPLHGTRYEARLEYDGAVTTGDIDDTEVLTLRSVAVWDAKTRRPLPVPDVDPIVISEVIRDVRSLLA